MNNYINNAKLNLGIFVSGFWIRVTGIAIAVSTFATRKSMNRTRKNIELIKEQLSNEQLRDLSEIDEILKKL